MSYDFTVSCVLPASPEEIYAAWLDGRSHTAMTGAAAKASKKPGARHSAWDGYITGRNVELVDGRKIVQTWRTTDFAADDPDSTITVTLRPVKAGTRLTLRHKRAPAALTSYENGGWQEHYFEPMRQYFERKSARSPRPRPRAKH